MIWSKIRRLIGIRANILDGRALADDVTDEIAKKLFILKESKNIVPGLAVVLIGDDPASQVYVRNKQKACQRVGIDSYVKKFDKNISLNHVLGFIDELNTDVHINGILVQLPLPSHINQECVINAISPEKDVDGFHPLNAGRLLRGESCLEPCTPKGIIRLIEQTGERIAGKNVCVIGRSNIVGKPVSLMLLKRDATVTMCHSKTDSLAKVASGADILVVAAGKPNIIDDRFVKEGAIVIDVGINRTDNGLTGDVDFKKASGKAGWITPVPGGVGPMTISMLLENTLLAAQARYDHEL
jgi:methylenetetrahydrofolate dehydrogenase (NADP+)/methenyltetrahydrofolate cyclohydrolase